MADCFASWEILAESDGSMLTALEFGDIDVFSMPLKILVPPPTTLLALKLSHFQLSTNWRKHLRDVNSMLDYFGKSVRTILSNPKDSDPQALSSSALKNLMLLNLRESVAATYTLPGLPAPYLRSATSDSRLLRDPKVAQALFQSLQISGGSSSIASALVVDPKGDPADKLHTFLLPLSFSRFQFDSLELGPKRKFLIEILVSVGLYYFLHSGHMDPWLSSSSLSDHSIAEEVHLLALESLITNRIAATPDSIEVGELMHEEMRQWWSKVSLYDFPPGTRVEHVWNGIVMNYETREERRNSVISAVESDWSSDKHRPIPSVTELVNMGILAGDKLISALVNEILHITTVPPLLIELVRRYRDERVGYPPTLASLPPEIWQVIAIGCVGDHMTAIQLSRVNKALNELMSKNSDARDELWDRLLRVCWNSDSIGDIGGDSSSKKKRRQVCPLRKFRQIWKSKLADSKKIFLDCDHCGEKHQTVSSSWWYQQYGSEHNLNFCACPNCRDFTGSWGNCTFHSKFIH